MTKWEYRRTHSFSLQLYGLKYTKDKDGWYLEYDADPRGKVRYPLNPDRDWSNMKQELTAWDEDAGWADLIMEVLNNYGKVGWEMVGFEGSAFNSSSYIFKRPTE